MMGARLRPLGQTGAILAILAVGMGLAHAATPSRSVLRLNPADLSLDQARQLQALPVDILSWGPSWVDVLVDEGGRRLLDSLGFRTRALIHDAQLHEALLRQRGYLDAFHDYGAIVAQIQAVASSYPSLVALWDIGDSWEKTQGIADRDIWAVKVSDRVWLDEPEEAEVVIMANLHAREIITPEIALALLQVLVEGYGSDPLITSLVNTRQIWIIPTCNPDGRDYVQTTDIWWRKNRRNNGNGTFGVDLNRNWGYQWGFDNIGSSPNPASETYRGTAPFSEPETRALRDFFQQRRAVISLSFHSYGNMWLYPWGFVPQNTPDHGTFVAIAESCVAYNGYVHGNAASGIIYLTNGDSDDWLYGEQGTKPKIFAFTPEVGTWWDGFHPDTSRIQTLISQNLGPCLYVIAAAGTYCPRPTISHEPLPDSEDVFGPYRVVAQITSPQAPVDPQSVRVHLRWQAGEFSAVPMTSAAPDVFEAWIPGLGMPGVCQYYLAAADTWGHGSLCPPGAPDSLFSFRTGPDTIPPSIVHVPLGDQPPQASPYGVQATITDNVGVGSAWVEFRVNQGPLQSAPLAPQAADSFAGLIDPGTVVSGDVVEYRVVARDLAAAQNVASHPPQGFHLFCVHERYQFDFEASPAGFTAVGGGDWQWGRPASGPAGAYSGQNLWATNLTGTYQNGSNSRLDSPPLSLTNVTSATLTFWHWYRFHAAGGGSWDGGNVKVSTDGGQTFSVLVPIGGYDGVVTNPLSPLSGQPAFGGPGSNGAYWHQETFDLSAYANRTVILRFHFASDASGVAEGWYVDDVVVLTPQSTIPLFRHTTRLQDTADTTGPYTVTAEITDDRGIAWAKLWYGVGGSSFVPVPMQLVSAPMYRASIPGQPFGSRVCYYLQAQDVEGNLASDPAGSPDSVFCFWVLDGPPQLGPLAPQVEFWTEEGAQVADTLTLANLGLVPLTFSVTDTSEGEPGAGVILADARADVSPACFDVLELWAGLQGEDLSFTVVHAGAPEPSVAIVSMDLDQDPSTGAPPAFGLGSPFHDVGSEAEVVVDPSNAVGSPLGVPVPSALLYRDGVFVTSSPLGGDGSQLSFRLSLSDLSDDGNAHVCVVAVPDLLKPWERDFAPERGHALLGGSGDATWLQAVPSTGVVPPSGVVAVTLRVDARYLTPGTHRARVVLHTNDPVTPTAQVQVICHVAALALPLPEPAPVLSLQAIPNPFHSSVVLSLGLPHPCRAVVRIYDLAGRMVCTLWDGDLPGGWHQTVWDGRGPGGTIPSGAYIGRVWTPVGTATLRLIRQ